MGGQIDKTIREFTKQAETFNEYQKSFFKEETKLGKNENVNTEIIEKICIALQCDVATLWKWQTMNENYGEQASNRKRGLVENG